MPGWWLSVSLSVVSLAQPAVPERGPLDLSSWSEHCGAVCVKIICEMLGRPVSLEAIERAAVTDDQGGMTLAEVCRLGKKHGVGLRAVRTDVTFLRTHLPAVVFLKPCSQARAHFCVVARYDEDRFLVVDPPGEAFWVSSTELVRRWDGVAAVAGFGVGGTGDGGVQSASLAGSAAVGVAFGVAVGAAFRRRAGKTPAA